MSDLRETVETHLLDYDSPEDAALKVIRADTWAKLQDTHERLRAVLWRKRPEPVRYYLNRMACLFLGLPADEETPEAVSAFDAPTQALVDELRRRVRDDGDRKAAAALGVTAPRRPRK